MPSLQDLDVSLLLQIAALVGLESVGRLSMINKHVCAAITPVLPSLCDVTAMRLILPLFRARTSDPVLVEYAWRRQIWWGLVHEVGGEYFAVAASPVASNGRFRPVNYTRHVLAAQPGLDLPFDGYGHYVPQKRPRYCSFHPCNLIFTHAISGIHRPPELDQRVINTILRGAKEALASKRAAYTVESYLQQHPAESVPLHYVVEDIEYVSLVYSLAGVIEPFEDFAPRRVAQRRLQRYIEQSSNAFLMQLIAGQTKRAGA